MSRSVELSRGVAELRVDPGLGCAITSFTCLGKPILRPTPASAIAARQVTQTSCYPLVPYSNRIRDARLAFGGREFELTRNFGPHPHSIHGVGWQRAWTTQGTSQHHARFVLHHDARGETAGAWPWPFTATQAFHLSASSDPAKSASVTLVAVLTLANTGTEAFPFGLGWHPFFPKDATTRVAFRADGVWRNDATQLPLRHVPIPRQWRFDRERPLGGLSLDNVFTGWRGAARLRSTASPRAITLDADRACAFLVVYAPPGGDFVAVEPVTHETDAFNRAAAGAANTGMRVLPPGAAFSCTMRIAAAAVAGRSS